MNKDEIIKRAAHFLGDIGIEICEGRVGANCFVPGIEIRNGKIIFERNSMQYAGDLFHEAGHIAVCDPKVRTELNGEYIANGTQKEGEEIAAILWSYFAATRAGVPLSEVFHAGGYKGESSWIADNFRDGKMIGLPLLEWMGIIGRNAKDEPEIRSWLRS